MNLKKEIWDQLESNREMRLKVAIALDIQEQTIDRNIERKSSVLTKYAALAAIAEYRGVMIHELIESIPEHTHQH